MEWNELKELLKECGLKAGQIYEIKNYITIEKGKYFNIEVKNSTNADKNQLHSLRVNG